MLRRIEGLEDVRTIASPDLGYEMLTRVGDLWYLWHRTSREGKSTIIEVLDEAFSGMATIGELLGLIEKTGLSFLEVADQDLDRVLSFVERDASRFVTNLNLHMTIEVRSRSIARLGEAIMSLAGGTTSLHRELVGKLQTIQKSIVARID